MAKANESKMKKLRYPIHVGDPVYLMMKLIRLVRNQATGILAADGMGYTFPQTAILVKLRETAGMSAAELARVAMVRPQTINKILVKLYADGLIEAKDDPAHGRIRRIFLTRHGKQITEKFDKVSNFITLSMSRTCRRRSRSSWNTYSTSASSRYSRPEPRKTRTKPQLLRARGTAVAFIWTPLTHAKQGLCQKSSGMAAMGGIGLRFNSRTPPASVS
jgi:DNA-binding MarR family transcriptional regulator